jgi:glucosamine--fructose-6-phosphate aminotransferase (isomerizing)
MITREGLGMNDAIETCARETSETYTVSYTTTLLAMAMLASAMGADSLLPDKLALVPGSVRNAIEGSGTEEIPLPQRSLQIVGAGHAAVTAREGALKVREASRLLAEGYDAEFFLHGTAVPLTSTDHLLALTLGDEDGIVAAVARAAAASGVSVTSLEEPSPLPSLLAQIPYAVRVQLLAARFAAERGQNPDRVIVGAWEDKALWDIGSPLR